jgi:GAF domain-containing protein
MWERMSSLGAALSGHELTLEQYRRRFLDLVLERFDGSRASIWRFVQAGDGPALRCAAALRSDGVFVTDGELLRERHYRDYFVAMRGTGVFACADTRADMRLAAVRDRYDTPGAARALLDAALLVNGGLFGALCCEDTRQVRPWQLADEADIRRMAYMLSTHVARLGLPDQLRMSPLDLNIAPRRP